MDLLDIKQFDLTLSNGSLNDSGMDGHAFVNVSGTSGGWVWKPVAWSWWTVIQLLLALLGIFGNLLVLVVLIRRRSFKNPTDILIGGLAAADFLTSFLMIPQSHLSEVPDTALGYTACKLVYSSFFLWLTITASVFTLTAIAIERYIAVVHHIQFKRWVQPRNLVYWFLTIWLLALVINSRTFATTIVDRETMECSVRYTSEGVQILVGIIVFLLSFIIPVAIMIVCYSLIARFLRQRSKLFKPNRSNPHKKESCGPSGSIAAARLKVIKLMLIVIVTFIVCWSADSIALLLYNVRVIDRSYLYSTVYHVFVLLAFFNTCANPLIYAIHYDEFRSAVRDLFSCTMAVRDSLFGKDSDRDSSDGSVPPNQDPPDTKSSAV